MDHLCYYDNRYELFIDDTIKNEVKLIINEKQQYRLIYKNKSCTNIKNIEGTIDFDLHHEFDMASIIDSFRIDSFNNINARYYRNVSPKHFFKFIEHEIVNYSNVNNSSNS